MTDGEIILHQFGRGPWAPSLSPFPVKLETYLKMAKIPYKSVFGRSRSSKGKMPWITYNGVEVADSSFIIEFLNDKYNINLNSHLSTTDQAIARAFHKMVDENLYWTLVLQRWFYDKDQWIIEAIGLPRIIGWVIKRGLKSQVEGHGIGRHSYEEVMKIMEGDMKAISDFLGTKQFLFGDQACETDCAVFGQLSQFRWQMPKSEGEKLVNEKYTNLRDYCDRMKNTFWPDWDECITKGQKPNSK